MPGISHLPPTKKQELAQIVELLRSRLPAEQIILFGSHARGDWVHDRYRDGDTTFEYASDYDILVIVKSEAIERNFVLRDELMSELQKQNLSSTPVSLLIDTVRFINSKLQEGNYFYLDIIREGVVLYDSGNVHLTPPEEPTPKQIYYAAKENSEFWLGKATAFMKDFYHNMADGELYNAAFHLSQVVESYLFALLLVHTGYKPKSHNIEKIEQLVKEVVPDFKGVFVRTTDRERQLFDLLKRAYIEARYSKDYEVKEDDLKQLATLAEDFSHYVQGSCLSRIKHLEDTLV